MNCEDLRPEEQKVLLVDVVTIRSAERLIESCEHCNATGVEISFDWILDRVTGSDSTVTDYYSDGNAKSSGTVKLLHPPLQPSSNFSRFIDKSTAFVLMKQQGRD
jgi:hypothetical protein